MVRVVTSLTHHRREIYFSTLCYIMSHSRRRLRGETRFRRRSVASEAHKKRLPDRSLALGVERLHLALGLPVPVLRGEERGVGSAETKMVRMSKEKRAPLRVADIFPSQGVGLRGAAGQRLRVGARVPQVSRRTFQTAPATRPRPKPIAASVATYTLAAARGRVGGSGQMRSRGGTKTNESSRVSVERRCGRVPSETRAPRVRERVRTVAEVLNRRHVVRCACAACVEVLAPEQHRAENKNRPSLVGPEWHGALRGQRTTKSTSASSTGRFVSFFRSRVTRHALCYISFSSAASPAARRR